MSLQRNDFQLQKIEIQKNRRMFRVGRVRMKAIMEEERKKEREGDRSKMECREKGREQIKLKNDEYKTWTTESI